jgi:hypothetical protein
MENRLFTSLSKDEKIEFFLNCQDLLATHHPQSSFLLRKLNVHQRIPYMKDFHEKYKGYCYQDANITVLYNFIVIADPNDPIGALKAHIWHAPHPEYNAVSIDFVAFRDMKDCLNFCKAHYDPRIKYALFVKNNKPKLYPMDKLVGRVFHLPS